VVPPRLDRINQIARPNCRIELRLGNVDEHVAMHSGVNGISEIFC
jgi:hypothetical protein